MSWKVKVDIRFKNIYLYKGEELIMKDLYLLSNAHLDPVWQWGWEEGAASAISTFRSAADFCEEFDTYIFNHNEAILYEWVEEYEPDLFKRIQALVQKGKWHIMGGWYLQPDCNMPSGESLIRQIEYGRKYFREKFNVIPTTAINFDSFGHSRGLVQIMKKYGYDSYIFMRPDDLKIDGILESGNEFIWRGYDGSEIIAHKIWDMYLSPMGKAAEKAAKFMNTFPNREYGLVLWGVGNHGGGPTRGDIVNLAKLDEENSEWKLHHSTPEQYFGRVAQSRDKLPIYDKDLVPRFVGCYTSQIRIKQKHRQLENELYSTEKMIVHAALEGLIKYPKKKLEEISKYLMLSQFHDVLPGSSVQSVEDMALNMLGAGLFEISKLKAKAFFALANGQPAAKQGVYPILVYNPHPYPIKTIVECEFMLADQNREGSYTMPTAYDVYGNKLLTQCEKEDSNLNFLDWRKRVVFEATLEPYTMNRYDCRTEVIPQKPLPKVIIIDSKIVVKTSLLDVVIDKITGLVSSMLVNGNEILKESAFKPLVIEDSSDPWEMLTNSFRNIVGEFTVLTEQQVAELIGINTELSPVHIIEDGVVRTVIEVLMGYGLSRMVIRYTIPKNDTYIDVSCRVIWNEKDKALKLAIPLAQKNSTYHGQAPFGISDLFTDGSECVSQKWCAAINDKSAIAVLNNGIYGSDFCEDEIRLTLLRSPAYCAFPYLDCPILPTDRFLPRIDQGERVYNFRLLSGDKEFIMKNIEREALGFSEIPMAISFFPSGKGDLLSSTLKLDCEDVIISSMCYDEEDRISVRIYNPTNESKEFNLKLGDIEKRLHLKPFEFTTFPGV